MLKSRVTDYVSDQAGNLVEPISREVLERLGVESFDQILEQLLSPITEALRIEDAYSNKMIENLTEQVVFTASDDVMMMLADPYVPLSSVALSFTDSFKGPKIATLLKPKFLP